MYLDQVVKVPSPDTQNSSDELKVGDHVERVIATNGIVLVGAVGIIEVIDEHGTKVKYSNRKATEYQSQTYLRKTDKPITNADGTMPQEREFKVGDKVRIKDIIIGTKSPSGYPFSRDMRKYVGNEYIISVVEPDRIHIKDMLLYSWHKDWLEHVD